MCHCFDGPFQACPSWDRQQQSQSPKLEGAAASKVKKNATMHEFLLSTSGPSKDNSPLPKFLLVTGMDGVLLGKVLPLLIVKVIKGIAGDLKCIKKIDHWYHLEVG